MKYFQRERHTSLARKTLPLMKKNQRYSDPATPNSATDPCCFITAAVAMKTPVECTLSPLVGRSPPFLSVPMLVVDKTRVLTVIGSVVGCDWMPVSLTCKTVDEFVFALLNCICIFCDIFIHNILKPLHHLGTQT